MSDPEGKKQEETPVGMMNATQLTEHIKKTIKAHQKELRHLNALLRVQKDKESGE